MQSKYPNVRVALLGEDEMPSPSSSACSGRCARPGFRRIKAFTLEACSSDYYHLLETVLRTVETI